MPSAFTSARPPQPPRGRRARRYASIGVGVAAAVAMVGTSATAASTSWLQKQTSANGLVTRTVDGDTVSVDAWGDGIKKTESVRNAGIQAMETGQCHAAEATKAMTALTLGKQVKMSAAYSSASSLGRPVRFVDAKTASGYVDTQLSLLSRGLAIPLVIPPETGRWKTYWAAAQKSAATHAGIWDTDYCKSGPSQNTPIKVWVNYDGDGDENVNVNGEYARILNQGTQALSLKGWWLRSAAQDSYFFPSDAVVQPGKLVTLYVGKGTRTATSLYWGNSVPRFKNVDEPGGHGSGVYLFDPDGDLRSHAMYPCLYACSSTLQGKVKMGVNYDAPNATDPNGEYITLTPSTSSAVDLSYAVLSVWSSIYEIHPGTVVKPGERLVVRIGKGTNSRLAQYWGKTSQILTNSGQAVKLRTTEDVRITCSAWGTGRC